MQFLALALLLLTPQTIIMRGSGGASPSPPSFVDAAANSGSVTVSTTSGNSIALLYFRLTAVVGDEVTAITDSGGVCAVSWEHSANMPGTAAHTGEHWGLWFCPSTNTTTSQTLVPVVSAGTVFLRAVEISGGGTFDTSVCASNSTSVGSLTTSAPALLVAGLSSQNGSITATGYTEALHNTSNWHEYVLYKQEASAGTFNPSLSASSNVDGCVFAIVP